MDENMGGAEPGQLSNGVVAVGVLPSKVGSRQVQPSKMTKPSTETTDSSAHTTQGEVTTN